MAAKRVYVIGPEGGPYKIGVSGGIGQRLKDLQTGNWERLELVCSCEGNEALELELHHLFKNCRLQGEWFNLSSSDLTVIRELFNDPSELVAKIEENRLDFISKPRKISNTGGGRKRQNKTHCKHGHPMSGDNLYITSEGRRQCKTCNAGRNVLYRLNRNNQPL